MRPAHRCIPRRPMPASAPTALGAPLPPGRGGTTGRVAAETTPLCPSWRYHVRRTEQDEIDLCHDIQLDPSSQGEADSIAKDYGSVVPLLDDRKAAALTLENPRKSLAAD